MIKLTADPGTVSSDSLLTLEPNEASLPRGPTVVHADYMSSLRDADADGRLNFGTFRGRALSLRSDWASADEFTHLPEASGFSDYGFVPDSTLETPISDLLQHHQGSNRHWGGWNKICRDAPGGTLVEANTRHLSALGEFALQAYRSEREVRYIEMGAGAGVAAGEAARMPNVRVETLALSPTSDRFRLTKSWEEIVRDCAERFHADGMRWDDWSQVARARGVSEEHLPGLRRLYYRTLESPENPSGFHSLLDPAFPIATQTVLALHALWPSAEIFQSNGRYLTTQHIGEFPENVKLPAGKYQLMHDDRGPLFHGTKTQTRGERFVKQGIVDLLAATFPLLAEDGAIVRTMIELNDSNREQLQDLANPFNVKCRVDSLARASAKRSGGASNETPPALPRMSDLVVMSEGSRPEGWRGEFDLTPLIVAKSSSPLAAALRKELGLGHVDGLVVVKHELLQKIISREMGTH